jgi:hypothetical protein
MSKKPITNPKYQSVQKVLDTGTTINNVKSQSDQFISKRKNELFKRIKPNTLVKLIEKNPNTESIYNLADESEGYTNNDMTSNYSIKTTTTSKTVVTAVTYVTEMLGNLVNYLMTISQSLSLFYSI